MKLSDLIRLSLQNLSRRKARTALTIVGVLIGTISIVVMISIGLGMSKQYDQQVMQLGSLTAITMESISYGMEGEVKQKLDDKLAMKIRAIDHVDSVLPIYMLEGTLYYANKYASWRARICGVDFAALQAMDADSCYYMTRGKMTDRTALISTRAFQDMYNTRNYNMVPNDTFQPGKGKLQYRVYLEHPLDPENYENYEYKYDIREYALLKEDVPGTEGGEIYLNLPQFHELVKGMKKQSSQDGQKSIDKKVSSYSKFLIIVDRVDNVAAVQEEIEKYGFKTSSLSATLEPMKNTSDMLQMVLGGVGAIAMIVSAISIANTMIMSIYERTKEIGIMKVLGCTVSDIRKMFLFEAGTIGAIGGVVGCIIGFIVITLINRFGGEMFSALMNAGAGTDAIQNISWMYTGGEGIEGGATEFCIMPIWLPVMAICFAIVVGLLSGYYPAKRATKISAIEAMKTDG